MTDKLAERLREMANEIQEYPTPGGFVFDLNHIAALIEQRHFKSIENRDTLTIFDVMAHYEGEFTEMRNIAYAENQDRREVLANEIVDTCERLLRQIRDYRKL